MRSLEILIILYGGFQSRSGCGQKDIVCVAGEEGSGARAGGVGDRGVWELVWLEVEAVVVGAE